MPVRQGQTQLGLILEVGNKGQITLRESAHRLWQQGDEDTKGGGIRCAGRAYIRRPENDDKKGWPHV